MPTSIAVVAPSTRNSTDLKSRDFIAAFLYHGYSEYALPSGVCGVWSTVGLNDRRFFARLTLYERGQFAWHPGPNFRRIRWNIPRRARTRSAPVAWRRGEHLISVFQPVLCFGYRSPASPKPGTSQVSAARPDSSHRVQIRVGSCGLPRSSRLVENAPSSRPGARIVE